MQTFVHFIERQWVSFAVGTLLGLLGIYISFALRSRKAATYIFREATILQPAHDSWSDLLEIKYNGVQVRGVTTVQFGIWNDGNVTINGSDIVKSHPLRIIIPDGSKILVADIFDYSREEVSATISIDQERFADIGFEFLDPGDGFTVLMLHSAKAGSVGLTGTVKGIPSGIRYWHDKLTVPLLGPLTTFMHSAARIFLVAGIMLIIATAQLTEAFSIPQGVRFSAYAAVIFILFGDVITGTLTGGISLSKVRSVPKFIRENDTLNYALMFRKRG